MNNTNRNALVEALTSVLASKPELQERFSKALGASPKELVPNGRISFADRKKRIRQRFNRLCLKHQLRNDAA